MRASAFAAIFALSMPFLAIGQTDGVEMRNQEVVRRYLDQINRRDAKAAAAEFATDTAHYGRPVGREGIEARLQDTFSTFPDWHVEILEMTAAGEIVVVRCRVSGTHRGAGTKPVNGMPVGAAPTGKRFEVTHMHWHRLRDGKIVEHYSNRDDLGMLRQLGLLPAAEP